MAVGPPGEAIHSAVRWVGAQRTARPEARLVELIDEAGRRFDLDPSEQEWLWTLLTDKPREG